MASRLHTFALVHCTALSIIGESAAHQSNVAASELSIFSVASITGCTKWNKRSSIGVLDTTARVCSSLAGAHVTFGKTPSWRVVAKVSPSTWALPCIVPEWDGSGFKHLSACAMQLPSSIVACTGFPEDVARSSTPALSTAAVRFSFVPVSEQRVIQIFSTAMSSSLIGLPSVALAEMFFRSLSGQLTDQPPVPMIGISEHKSNPAGAPVLHPASATPTSKLARSALKSMPLTRVGLPRDQRAREVL
mmetsp:Transcript_141018/g.351698  ORF Transcript_141018/g.351698 Transcript_141018/m.351698 type:complete len:247 (+) Transcript_141018:819-1559(+)